MAQRWPATNRYLTSYTYPPLADRERGGINLTVIGVFLLGILLMAASSGLSVSGTFGHTVVLWTRPAGAAAHRLGPAWNHHRAFCPRHPLPGEVMRLANYGRWQKSQGGYGKCKFCQGKCRFCMAPIPAGCMGAVAAGLRHGLCSSRRANCRSRAWQAIGASQYPRCRIPGALAVRAGWQIPSGP